MSNHIALNWKQFPNNKIINSGFYAEYQAKDYEDLDKAQEEPIVDDDIKAEDLNLYYEKNSKTLILKPDIMPIDMIGKVDDNGRLRGDWWEIYDTRYPYAMRYEGKASFELRTITGSPKRMMIYQSNVSDSDKKMIHWYLRAGDGMGTIQNEQLQQNQGIVFWVDEQRLPQNEDNELNFYLWHTDPKNKYVTNSGIYIYLKKDSDIVINHFMDMYDTEKRPPSTAVLTQVAKGNVSAGKSPADWSGATKFYCLMIVDKYILFGINGFTNAFSMECQNYDVGVTKEGLPYPVILRENATLQIEGKGQALFGLKKLAYYPEATLKTKGFRVGYEATGKSFTRIKSATNDTDVDRKWRKKGKGVNSEVYAEIKLKAEQMSIDEFPDTEAKRRLNAYRRSRSENTPIFIKTKFVDDMKTDVDTITLPSNIDGRVVSYTETASANENNVVNDFTVNIDCYGDFAEMYQSLLQRKLLNGEPVLQIGGQGAISAGEFIFKEFSTSIKNYGDISLKLSGQNTILHSLKKQAGFIISYDDRKGYTDIKAMQNVCGMLNMPFETDIFGARIPETEEGQEGIFTFQPNVSFLDILTKLAGIQGHNLYVAGGKVQYKKQAQSPDFIVGRTADYACEGITYGQNDVYKSRVYVIGKAAKNTKEYKRGDKLIGIWRSDSIEKEIGYDVFTKEDETLTSWKMIQGEGEKLWSRFNKRLYTVKFTIEDCGSLLSSIKLFNVFEWRDEGFPMVHKKLFTVIGYTKEVDQSNVSASITGVVNEA